MHTTSLPEKTLDLLEAVSGGCDEIKNFLLVGGTALALQIAHRLSEDLDFAFPEKKLDRKLIATITNQLTDLGKNVAYNNPVDAIDDAINDGIDLDDYQQDYLVDGVKLTFFAFGDYDIDRELIKNALSEPAKIGFVNVADINTLFVSKCITLTDRVKSRDLFDLWSMTHGSSAKFSTQDIFKVAQEYRPNMQYEHISHRLLNWKIPSTDESFSSLISEPVTVESIREQFLLDVNEMEVKAAKVLIANECVNHIPFTQSLLTVENVTEADKELEEKNSGIFFQSEGNFSGRIIDVTDGVVVQRINRLDTVRHDASKLSAAVKEGDVVDIGYRGGVGVVGGLDKDKSRGK